MRIKLFTIFFICNLLLFIEAAADIDWKKIANDLILDYQGKITSIEQLNSSTCWAVLSSEISNDQAVEIAENIGYYIRNVTGALKGETPSIHVFVNGKHVATARYSGLQYKGKVDLAEWNPSVYKGEYRP